MKNASFLDAHVVKILDHPKQQWRYHCRKTMGSKRFAGLQDQVDWSLFNPKDYLFTHDTIVASVKVAKDGYTITDPCHQLVNANGNAWSNQVIQHAFRTFIGKPNFYQHYQIQGFEKGIILDSVLRPVTYVGSNGKKAQIFYCFTQGSKITCQNGELKPIQKIRVGDKIYNADGVLTQVVQTKSTYKDDIVKVKCCGKIDQFISDDQHPYLVYNVKSKQKEWIRAKDLQVGMWLYQPNIKQLNRNKKIDNDLAWLLGFYLAQGSLVKRNKKDLTTVQFSLHQKELQTVLNIIQKVISKIGPYKVPFFKSRWTGKNLYRTVYGSFDYKQVSQHGYTIRVRHRKIAELCYFYCGSGSYTKKLNNQLINDWDRQSILSFIAGYFDGDGNIRNQRLSVKSASNCVIQQLGFILSSLNMPYKVTGKWKTATYSPCASLQLDSNSLSDINNYMRFKKCNINVKIRNGNRQIIKIENAFLRKITKINKIKENSKVFDIQVKSGNSFIVNGVAVHNCDLLVATNRKHKDIVKRIINGQLTTMSMGCSAAVVQCSYCGKTFKDDQQQCQHLQRHIGQFLDRNGEQVMVAQLIGALDKNGKYIQGSCQFIEASWVQNPAFQGAVLNYFLYEDDIKRNHQASKIASQKWVLQDLFSDHRIAKLRVADKYSGIAVQLMRMQRDKQNFLNIAKSVYKGE